jgi:hypothetical protein
MHLRPSFSMNVCVVCAHEIIPPHDYVVVFVRCMSVRSLCWHTRVDTLYTDWSKQWLAGAVDRHGKTVGPFCVCIPHQPLFRFADVHTFCDGRAHAVMFQMWPHPLPYAALSICSPIEIVGRRLVCGSIVVWPNYYIVP